MTRSDSLAHYIEELRLDGRIDETGLKFGLSADEFEEMGIDPVSGGEVSSIFGHLIHYTQSRFLESILSTQVGLPGWGVYLSPTPYAGCVVPYRLGLRAGSDAWIIVDVRNVEKLWGPGKAHAGPPPWPGGHIEFYSSTPLDRSAVVDYGHLSSCGDL
ncbi:hypothetical protein [Streptomyces peucetius]|uniref:Knr4/Smi1-like domain-containing protein n=1 Tax=Streptomyces peucetius TaxID=1950 RepID=A0ABY6I6S3_STRPE|nr:hypothetical protein [Streptomyces peucetius]UYQ62701.1 hypothetical protein OGH68_15230 [Streptomyces peucetius]